LEELEAISSDLVKSQKSTAGHSETIKHLTLELEAVKKENTTLTGQLEKLKRTNTELKSQLENLKKLEGKNEKDSRVVVALEAEKGELEARVTEMEAADRANVKEMKRLRKEISSLKVITRTILCASLMGIRRNSALCRTS
jgi:predicted RNase H-like nuclease (RuvC/YqgF family)